MNARLNVSIARGSGYSRRKADALILSGRVRVNDTIVTQPYYRISQTDEVSVQGRSIQPERLRYVALNKPAGYACTCADRYALRKVRDMLPRQLQHLYPVGRLDKNSRGLLFLTNDGNFCFKVTHPRFMVEKEYRVGVAPPITDEDVRSLKSKKGITIKGVLYHIADCVLEKRTPDVSWLKITAVEGKKRHIRVVFGSLGYRVVDLQRMRIGRITLGNLKEGTYRFLTEQEVASFVMTRVGAGVTEKGCYAVR